MKPPLSPVETASCDDHTLGRERFRFEAST
jgi:hypothetical protein